MISLPLPTDRAVAAIKLPINLNSLLEITNAFIRDYGEGLTMRQVGDFMIIELPVK